MAYIAPPFTPTVTISGTDLIRNTDEKLQTIANDVGDYLETQTQAIYTDLDAQMTVIENDYNTVLKPEIEQKMDDLLGVNPDGTYYTKSAIDALVASKVAKVTSTDNAIARFDGTTGAIQNSGVVIDDNGNIHIGNAIAWVSTYKYFSVGSTSIANLTNDDSLYMTGNSYYNGSTWKYISTNFATAMIANGGAYEWRTAPSGTAGSDITWTTALTFPNTGGIQLPNTAIANATTLDWYEEGTFAPTIIGTTTAGVGTHSLQYGKFTRIGDRVHIHFRVVWSAHTGTGNMTIGGLPFAANAEVGTFATNNLCALSGDLTYSGGALGVYISQGASALTVCTIPVSTGVVGSVAMDTASTLLGSITYRV